MAEDGQTQPTIKTGWVSRLTTFALAALLFESVTGLAITLAPFSVFVQWSVLAHSVAGLLLLAPFIWYLWAHWLDYRDKAMSDVTLLGYLSLAALALCIVSGLVVTWQGVLGIRMSPVWRIIHLGSTLVTLATGLPHLALVWFRARGREIHAPAAPVLLRATAYCLAAMAGLGLLTALYAGPEYVDEFPEDYRFLYGEDRPFAPSLAVTSTGGAFDSRSLSGSETCGSSGCHTEILQEWKPSAHRYAAMDTLFQGIQKVMAAQNGPESTRYCGGCHDPISLFSGEKTVFSAELTGQHGHDEDVSCLGCHAMRETDLQGNANYVMNKPPEYLWQWSDAGASKLARDFLIRTYPDEHNLLSKRMFKAPEYCAACHKQFIDEEVNNVGWVQLQNQYDNWKASQWYHEGDATRTIECRECHMPLVASNDPAAGDDADYNRTPSDGMHRSHRFIGANGLMPAILKLDGWEKQVELTNSWLSGDFEIAEIKDKWVEGPVIKVGLEVPEAAVPGESVKIRVVLVANKVGHDFPTGPLDIIQSWVELEVKDDAGEVIYASGRVDEKNFIEPGSFMFKAEPIDQDGNLIDRHNLWEMVGVRYRRALFPGYSDSVDYVVACPSSLGATAAGEASRFSEREQELRVPKTLGSLHVTAILNYRKVDQFLLNFLLGEDTDVTAPVVEMTRATATIEVRDGESSSRGATGGR